MSVKYELHTSADPTVTRIIPELAAEIGLNESIVLLQIAHWIKLAQHEHDGEFWTFQSVREMRKKAFSYWSASTINRIIGVLLSKKLIKSRDDLNLRKGDTTRWFALNVDVLRSLKSITVVAAEAPKPVRKSDRASHPKPPPSHLETGVFQVGTPPTQNDTPLTQDETASTQNGTALPEIPTEIPTETPSEMTAEADHSAAAARQTQARPPESMVITPVPGTRLPSEEAPPVPKPPPQQEAGRVMRLVHENILALTPMVAEQVRDLLKDFGVEALDYAISEAVTHNKRSLAYIEAVARRKASGRVGQDGQKYISGELAQFINH